MLAASSACRHRELRWRILSHTALGMGHEQLQFKGSSVVPLGLRPNFGILLRSPRQLHWVHAGSFPKIGFLFGTPKCEVKNCCIKHLQPKGAYNVENHRCKAYVGMISREAFSGTTFGGTTLGMFAGFIPTGGILKIICRVWVLVITHTNYMTYFCGKKKGFFGGMREGARKPWKYLNPYP